MKDDMSSEAITSRLKAASDLRDLCLKLGQARPLVVNEDTVPYKTILKGKLWKTQTNELI
jgi:hypothetical protein